MQFVVIMVSFWSTVTHRDRKKEKRGRSVCAGQELKSNNGPAGVNRRRCLPRHFLHPTCQEEEEEEEEQQSKWNTNLLRSIRAGGKFDSRSDCNCLWPVGYLTWKSMSRAPLNLLYVVLVFLGCSVRVGGKIYSNLLTVGREYGSIFELNAAHGPGPRRCSWIWT
ncbi:hypothetical protein SORBI_3008G019466 [Sorghum bicolor]|uniref:Uncharacterized protein n=1 Tax=Sorghum bicolor TaxID=4558 RepID=A0A1Z5R4F3_SORBI|nr:hypothetical protein SORBI_3008G019466 [Sorghum bicolor]